MRSLAVSSLCLAVLLAGWGVFHYVSAEKSDEYITEIREVLIPAVQAEEWETAQKSFKEFGRDWHSYKKAAAYFFDTTALNEADYSIARTEEFIKAKDPSNSAGELAALREQFKFLHRNESISMGNIF